MAQGDKTFRFHPEEGTSGCVFHKIDILLFLASSLQYLNHPSLSFELLSNTWKKILQYFKQCLAP